MRLLFFQLVFLALTCSTQIIYAQEEKEQTKEQILENKRQEIIKEEKEKLREKVEAINKRLEDEEITVEEAEKLKKEAAELHALNIENRITIMENEYEFEERNNDDTGYIAIAENGKVITVRVNEERERKYDKRTTSDLVIAAGFNNALGDGQSINDSDFKLAGSRFFEIGWAWKTRVFDNSNWLRLKYGFSFMFDGLKPTDNRYYVEDGDETFLQEFEYDLDKSKFRMDKLVAPVHFEFGPSSKRESKNYVRYSTEGKFKIGLGGYAGVMIGERQKLKYEIDGDKQKDKLKGDYNTNDFVYGLSGYMGWGWATLYAKYDLQPIFADPNSDLHNFSVGLRFDVD
ncbi:hypothetical protein MKO06_16385 [Gramella sp. GC03-9]|uniref:Outer membrane protein beta-barrel domain-containing protein n=1 Tax=Christiangramia oceanisediminis TaxID=2920386 RepID=A0A9X2RC80_9FLAO|nr:hypothetical protein [Gramella oceanisediminis]MCP9201489.1 hypothetical protein [Gramella oceanisediminis]